MGRVIQVVNASLNGALGLDSFVVLGPLDGSGVLREVWWKVFRTTLALPFGATLHYDVAIVLSGSSEGLARDVTDGRSLIERSNQREVEGQVSLRGYLGNSELSSNRLALWVPLAGRSDYVLFVVRSSFAIVVSIAVWVVVEELSWWRRRPAPAGARGGDDGST